ncbi:hypothetical protein BDZ90DRAFT_52512 [Jaminaea rosea]|uniref:PSD13 N-terminal domain-containing protein n=1 Tax=Jaminaea rosea TaxID=1569628 RepID=A0A316UM31_9BASI|nr:hypothetical protein BDZ90DRAFT_52512 [Jaminaea rosea]PWN26336.1 hypothetical protein BDZ90DRAFT_52512 [Jaminaea rosea]
MASSSSSGGPSAYLQQAGGSAASSLRPIYETLADQYDRKLYYQLLETTQSFFHHPDSTSGTQRYDLYQSFVVHWKSKVSDLSVAELAIAAAKQLQPDSQKAHDFLVGERDQVEKDTPAHLLLSIEATCYKLLLGQLEQVKKDVDAGQKILNSYDAVETVVSAAYYRVAAEYYKAKAMYQQYYTTSLLYLACLPHNGTEDDLTNEEKVERAHDLAIAAILGQGIWNFGELVSSCVRMDASVCPH